MAGTQRYFRKGPPKDYSARIVSCTNNQHYAVLLQEWYQEAARKEDRLQFVYRKVLNGLIFIFRHWSQSSTIPILSWP